MTKYAKHVSAKSTSQRDQVKADQVKNSAGGYVFKLDSWMYLDRFLILGSEGATYYASEKKLTRDNAKNVQACLEKDGKRTVDRIVEISVSGRAPKNDPAIFALALGAASENELTRSYALQNLSKVCRTASHLFQFAESVNELRGWGRGLRNSVGAWYNEKSVQDLSYQMTKYQQRNGWSHKDLMRLSHVSNGEDSARGALYRWAVSGVSGLSRTEIDRKIGIAKRKDSYKNYSYEDLPQLVKSLEEIKTLKDEASVAKLIKENRLTHEMVPTEWKNSKLVWEALLNDMPLTAMVRNLAKLTSVGLISPLSNASKLVRSRLENVDYLKKSRIHPIQLLSALKVYSSGHGVRGNLSWNPDQAIIDALNEAFYEAFALIEPTGKNFLLGVDVSGSMCGGEIAGIPGLDPRTASAAMAMVTARSEKNWHAMGFSAAAGGYGGRWGGGNAGFTKLDISPKMRLEEVIKKIESIPIGGTDCALPMIWAEKNNVPVDTFVVYTDNETWAGDVHPFQVLKNYRKKMGRDSKLIVVGMTATDFTIADPSDKGMLDVVGFDSSAPQLMADFSRE